MNTPISSPHQRRGLSTAQVMQQVILACVPGLAALTWFFGWGTLLNILWLSVLALGLEAFVLWLRGRPVGFYLGDYSALVTAVLLGLALPPTAPWWLGATGIAFAILIAKQLYGGLGYNPFNPAMVGYVVLLISFPVEMTTWLNPRGVVESPPALADSFRTLFGLGLSSAELSAWTGATLLDEFKVLRAGQLVSEYRTTSALSGKLAGLGWEWVNIAFLAGGLYLLWRRIITWHIPAGMLLSLALLSAFFYDGGSSASHGSPMHHLLSGATMLGAFFIATDPVSAATSNKGRLIYGLLIGSTVFVIRAWGNYPDAVAFAVLLGNFAAPMIDNYTQPRTFGHHRQGP